MARVAVAVALLAAGLLPSAVAAQEEDEASSVALEASVDVADLRAALATVSEAQATPVKAREYLMAVGEYPRTAASLSPRQYLYSRYPALAPRLNCVIGRESKWDPGAQNGSSGAAGLTQILWSTWLSTPQGKRGESRFNAYANLDAAAWLVTVGGGWRHWRLTVGGCP